MEEDDDAAVVEGGTTTSPKMITGVVMNGLSSGVGLQDGNEGNEEEEEGADPAEQTKKKIGRPQYIYMTFEGGGGIQICQKKSKDRLRDPAL